MNELALFAGAGGGILGGTLLGWRTVCAVEIEPFCREVLLRRQQDGCLPWFPIWDDVCTFNGRPWRGLIDVITGGFPCQDISAAGKGAGITGERSGLWSEMARIIGEVRPPFVLVENSPLLVSRGLDVVLSDLASLGYDAVWGIIGADDAGAPHRRKRIWILAYSDPDLCGCLYKQAREQSAIRTHDAQCQPGPALREDARENVANTKLQRLEGYPRHEPNGSQSGRKQKDETGPTGKEGVSWWQADPADMADAETVHAQGLRDRQGQEQHWGSGRWGFESRLGRVAHGMADRVDRLKAIGNGQVPAVAALAWDILIERISNEILNTHL